MSLQVKVGQVWHDQTGVDPFLYEITKVDPDPLVSSSYEVRGKKMDRQTKIVVDHDAYLGSTHQWQPHYVLLQEVSEELPNTLRSSEYQEPREKQCKNKGCRVMNDVGIGKCYWCGVDNPTED